MKMQPIILGVILLLLVFCYISKLKVVRQNNSNSSNSSDSSNKSNKQLQEGFEVKPKIPQGMGLPKEADIYIEAYEQSIKELGHELMFNLTIDPKKRDYDLVTGKEFNRLLVPLHIIRLLDGRYLGVLNNGKLYLKSDLYKDKLWIGPLNNSLVGSQEDGIGFRMVLSFPFNVNHERQIRLLGVGQDSKLYYKESEDIQSKWIMAENETNSSNADLVYLFCDFHQDKEKYYPLLYGITTKGDFVYKNLKGENPPSTIELDKFMSLPFTSPVGMPEQNIQVLKVFWDRNGFMIGIGLDFKLYQKRGIDWKNRPWETGTEMRGTNPGSDARVIDMIMDNDARMLSLKFMGTKEKPMIAIQKQDQTHYLADHDDPVSVGKNPKVFSDVQLQMYKSGLDWETYLSFEDPDEILYRSNNLQAIKQRSIMMNRLRLRKLCKSRNPTMNIEARNFGLERTLKKKENRVEELRNELEGLITPVTNQEPFYQGL